MLSKAVCNFIIVCCLIHFCSSLDELPEVDTPLGRVRGLWRTSAQGTKYAAFEGIPYGQPPVGDLRFEAPQPVSPWLGTWEANTPLSCMQAGFFDPHDLSGEENCLYLNVYVPSHLLNSSKKIDVIVMIHGGGFMVGSGHEGTNSSIFMDRDIIYVSINYRLGILGFLSTGDDVIPGNYGMKDQVLALKWVKDNIAPFGGNSDSVTIIGLSAGSASVHLQYFSPLSKGLFHKGVSQSGTALDPWAIRRNSLQRAQKLGTLVGCPSDSTKELKDCLKQRPAEQLLKQLPQFLEYGFLPFSIFAPVVETPSEGAFLSEEPRKLLSEGNVTDVPWITSTSRDDGLFPSALFWNQLDDINEKRSDNLCYFLDCDDTLPESKRQAVFEEILNYYLGPGAQINKQTFMNFTQILTDRLFAYPAEVAAKMQAKVSKSPVYYYLFDYLDGVNKAVEILAGTDEIQGVAHGEDGFYCYGTFAPKPFSEEDLRLMNACQDMYYSFASTGVPSFDGSDTWKPTGSDELTYLNVTSPDDLKLHKTQSFSSGDFWKDLDF